MKKNYKLNDAAKAIAMGLVPCIEEKLSGEQIDRIYDALAEVQLKRNDLVSAIADKDEVIRDIVKTIALIPEHH